MRNTIILILALLANNAFCSDKRSDPIYTLEQLKPNFEKLSISRYKEEILDVMNSVLTSNAKKKDNALDEILFGLSMVADYHGTRALEMIIQKKVKLSPKEMQKLLYKLAKKSIDWREVIEDFFHQKQLRSTKFGFVSDDSQSSIHSPSRSHNNIGIKKDLYFSDKEVSSIGTPPSFNLDQGHPSEQLH